MELPETRYARSGDVSIAYQVMGDGPFDLVFIPGFISNVELAWTIPKQAALFERLASTCRLIRFDKRGTGMSDRVAGIADLETRMDDVRVRLGDDPTNIAATRYAAERIPGARLVELAGEDHMLYAGDVDAVLAQIEPFLADAWAGREDADLDRVLATVLFTDIVGATATAAELGDRRWRELLTDHHALVRRELARFRGRELDTAGDGFFASFDGPAKAVRCACAISESVRRLGIELRAGLHTGECEVVDGMVGGIAVHIGARVAAQAGPSEVLVSSTVRDLVAGSGLEFEERGAAELKGVPGEWRLYAVSR